MTRTSSSRGSRTLTGEQEADMPEREAKLRPKPVTKKAAVGRDWHPEHIQPARTTFVSERNATRMWKL
jgi:hypothetical protein